MPMDLQFDDAEASAGADAGASSGSGPSSAAVPAGLPLDDAGPAPLRWRSRYLAAVVLADVAALAGGEALAIVTRPEEFAPGGRAVPVLVLAVPAWLIMVLAAGGYDRRCWGTGSQEYRRVLDAGLRCVVLMSVAVIVSGLPALAPLLLVALPAATLVALALRIAARAGLHRIRRAGLASHRVLVVGDEEARDVLVAECRRCPQAGLTVVGACRPSPALAAPGPDGFAHVRDAVAGLRADTVVVASSARLTPGELRRMAWSLEGLGVQLLVASALTETAAQRLHVRAVAGLPLLQIARPEDSYPRRLVKGVLDLAGSAALLVMLSPVLLVAAAAVRLTSPGPVLFRQERVGRDGRPFVLYKFRSMSVDAESRLEQLKACNDHADGVLFKLRHDPRVTRVGAVLRRYSVDELPQLVNVLKGEMSLVGPRPALPGEVERYEPDTVRRLRVKPGLTGLWQVSGRADLDWHETVRLDLFYVENWSVAFDLQILWRTASAVLRGAGAR